MTREEAEKIVSEEDNAPLQFRVVTPFGEEFFTTKRKALAWAGENGGCLDAKKAFAPPAPIYWEACRLLDRLDR